MNKLNNDLQRLIALMPCHVYWKDLNGAYLGCNDLQAKSAGVASGNELIGKTDYDMPWKKHADLVRKTDIKVMESGEIQVVEEPSTLADGREAIFLSNKIPLRDDDGKIFGILGISTDITHQKQYINKLEAKQGEVEIALENILNNVPAHIFWKDRNCILLGCNDLQAKNMGFSSGKEMIGKSNYDAISSNQPEKERKRQADAITKADLEVIKAGTTHTIEEPLVLQDGTTAIYLSKKTPLRNEKNEILGILGISIDITKQKKTEKELRETQHKLDGMTLVSASTAHELRTPLAGLNIGVSTLKNILPQLVNAYQLAKDSKLPVPYLRPNFTDLLLASIDSMQREISGSLIFIDMMLMNLKPEVKGDKTKVFSIHQCIDKALARYPFMTDQDQLIHWKKDEDQDFKVAGNDLLVIHVLFNLLKNAIYYVTKAGKGNIEIWTGCDLSRNSSGQPSGQSSGHKLCFKDTGTGISSDFLPHVFDRFFSKTRHGAGVGLTFCKMVMENLGGSITCESVEGDYTLFTLFFPDMP